MSSMSAALSLVCESARNEAFRYDDFEETNAAAEGGRGGVGII